MNRRRGTRGSSNNPKTSSAERGIAYGLSCAIVMVLIILVLSPRAMNGGTLPIVRFLCALAGGLSAYLFLGEIQVQGTIRKVLELICKEKLKSIQTRLDLDLVSG